MNMKNLLFPALLGCCALIGTLPLPAVQQASTYAEAKPLVKDDGYILVGFADGWDKFSKKRAEKLMASDAIRKAAGEAVMIPLPVPEYTNDETKKAQKERYGELSVPDANSYPALILLDAKGKHYATLCGRDVACAKVSEVADLLVDRMEKGRQRARLLAEAEKAKGPEKAKLTYEAYQIDGLTGFGKGFGGHLAKLDPKDSSGMVAVANYNAYGFAYDLNKKSVAEGLAEVDKLLANPAYTDRQKQRLCAAAIGMLRRKAGPAGVADMRRLAERMKAYAPNSPEGQAADFILREWVKPLRYEEGWTSATLPVDKEPVELEGKLPIAEPGTYAVRFDWKSGNKSLIILAVELYDGEDKVAEDRHRGETGRTSKGNIYNLKVPAAVKEPHLFISVDMPNRNSAGEISIIKL